jgi:DNA (cytosine-5)-methyltransferase 1
MTRPTFLSLFSGIGGLDLGLERAGWECVGQVEIDPWRQQVLARHWPNVPRWGDIREVDPHDFPRADLIAGGFPCPPFSSAGRRLGMADERWAWPDMVGVVRVVGPRYVLVENVAALLDAADAFGTILADLAALGFDAEWGVLSACAVGAPHTRERLFLVAYPDGGHGTAGLGAGQVRPGPLPDLGDRARAWRDRVTGALEASRSDGREADGTARRLVAMGGDAVVPQVAELIGRRILETEYAA